MPHAPADRRRKHPVLLLLLQLLGRFAAHCPEGLLRLLSHALGDGIFLLLPRRRRLILSNLHHAFPDREECWRCRIGRESCRRLVETGLLSLALPYLGPERLRRIAWAGPELLALHARHQADPAPVLICSPHLAHWEVQTAQPLTVPGAFPEFGIIYRPLDSPAADRFVRAARERFGMRLLSRKEGFAEALKILRRRGFVGILFDQNAGLQGALTTLFGRVCATTELPGLLAEKFSARVYGIYPRRHGFWRVEIGARELSHDGTSEAVTFGLNRWLEEMLTADEDLCASWLWAHDRWRHQDQPALRLRLESRRNLLAAELRARGLNTLPRRTRIWIRLPNWLGDVVMTAPLLRALREGRPDAELILVGRAAFGPLLETWGLGDRFVPLPARGPGYFRAFRRLTAEHPDVWLLFTQSLRGDLEAWCAGSRQRFGLIRAGQRRPLLSHRFPVPKDWDQSHRHQLALWTEFLGHFGLTKSPDLSPLGPRPEPGPDAPVGLIIGSENFPAKRWPVAAWRGLIEALPGLRFELLGTPGDRPLAATIAVGWPEGRVRNRAGETDLTGFAAALSACRLLVSNDTGGMHLANALGVPVLALFGPTNPLRTGPVFATLHRVLQPLGCPPHGGGDLSALSPQEVAAALREMLPISPA